MLNNPYHVIPLLAYTQINTLCLFFESCDDRCVYNNGYCVLYSGVYEEIFELLFDKNEEVLKFIDLSYKHHKEHICEKCYFIGSHLQHNGCYIIDFMQRLCITNNKEIML